MPRAAWVAGNRVAAKDLCQAARIGRDLRQPRRRVFLDAGTGGILAAGEALLGDSGIGPAKGEEFARFLDLLGAEIDCPPGAWSCNLRKHASVTRQAVARHLGIGRVQFDKDGAAL